MNELKIDNKFVSQKFTVTNLTINVILLGLSNFHWVWKFHIRYEPIFSPTTRQVNTNVSHLTALMPMSLPRPTFASWIWPAGKGKGSWVESTQWSWKSKVVWGEGPVLALSSDEVGWYEQLLLKWFKGSSFIWALIKAMVPPLVSPSCSGCARLKAFCPSWFSSPAWE